MGLEKNFFSGFNYSLILMLAALLGQLLFFFAPFVGLLLLPSWLGLFYLVSVIAMLGHYLQQMRMINNEKGLGIFIPFLELTIPTNLRRWKLLHYR